MNDEERLALRTELATMRTNGARRQDLSQHACKRLFFDFGIRPSMAIVRDLTQTGSASDIPKDIDAFWARIRSASRVRIEGGALPEGLQERAGELLGQLFQEAQRFAIELLETERLGSSLLMPMRPHIGPYGNSEQKEECRSESGSVRASISTMESSKITVA